jgi:acetyltransferase-like isoleucine patch superfamily enzyme
MSPEEFRALLERAAAARAEELRARFNRSLPFGDAMFDRWERARRLGFGEGTSIYDSACVFGDVSIGANVWIGPWVMLDGSGGGLRIGDYVSVSAGVQIYTHDTVHWALSGGVIAPRQAPVSIGSCVYIGAQAIIARGVSVGQKSVIAANALVLDDVAEGTIVAGAPAAPIGHVEGQGEAVRMVFTHRREDAAGS